MSAFVMPLTKTQHRIPRSAERGVSMVVVIVLLVVSVFLSIAAILLHAEKVEVQATQAALLNEIEKLDLQIGQVSQDSQSAAVPTGFAAQGGGLPTAQVRDRLKALSTEFFETRMRIAFESLRQGQAGGVSPESAAKIAQDARLVSSLQDLVPFINREVFQAQLRLKRLQAERQVSETRVSEARKYDGDIDQRHTSHRTDLDSERSRVNSEMQAEESAFAMARAETEAKIQQNGRDLEDAMFAAGKAIPNLESQIGRVREKLSALRRKELVKHEISVSYGRIVRSDASNRVAFIDLGSQHRIVPGLKFMVVYRGEKGRFVFKAEIEVKKVHDTFSEASITKVFDRDLPVVDGDRIVNPLYHPKRPVVVAFAGEDGVKQRLRLKFSTVAEAANRIREMGGEVREEITQDVDFVIRTALNTSQTEGTTWENYPSHEKAVLLEIPLAWADRVPEDPDRPGIYEFLGD